MLQTLLVIPDWLLHGWLTLAWLLFAAAWLVWSATKTGWKQAAGHYLPTFLLVAAILYFVFPGLSVDGVNPQDPTGELVPVGLAIRGYGLCLMLAISLAVGLVLERSRAAGLNVERMLGLCFWIVMGGLVGARAFYVIQKWDSFVAADGSVMWAAVFNMTQGGLVVFGSFAGGLVAILAWIRINRAPALETLDALAPAMLLGLAIGRIGCFLNGCCYGGECEFPFSTSFPRGTAPWVDQLERGTLLGITPAAPADSEGIRTAGRILSPSPAATIGLQPGDRYVIPVPDPVRLAAASQYPELARQLEITVATDRLDVLKLPLADTPEQSLGAHPAQIYSAIEAGLLCLLLWLMHGRRQFAGQVFATLMVLHPVSRFLLEVIRADEAGVFGTKLTISQWFSIGLLAAGVVLYLALVGRRPASIPASDRTDPSLVG
jgi:phosphatidylglycerol---prolipoprotein diacylglyceryl transferase